jgi:type II secretory pathway predicted ATPase ExeA
MSIDAPWTAKRDRTVSLHAHARPGWLTYETFYGLTEKPFSLSSNPSFFYNSSSHAAAFDDLLSGIRRRESLSVLSGDIGTGKTTLCRTVLENLDRQTFSAFVADPFATREDLLKVVLVEFGIVSSEDLATGRLRGASRTELSYLLYEFLGTLSPLQAFAVVFIDEAQNLSLPLLEEIRILSDSDGRERQLQVVLVGQPELRDKLRLPEMRQVAQRVSVCCGLEPLDRDGVDGYIAHRLHVAGGTPDRVRFTREANDAIFDASRGVPRLINRLCDRALHHGHLAKTSVIDQAMFGRAYAEVKPLLPARHTEPWLVVLSPNADPMATFPSENAAARESAYAVDRSVVDRGMASEPLGGDEPAIDGELGVTRDLGVPAERVLVPSAPTVVPVEGADAWFAEADARVNAAEADTVTLPLEHPPVAALPRVEPRRRSAVPLTHMEMIQRVWLRRIKIAVVLLVIMSGAGFGLTLAVSLLSQPVNSPSVKSPAPPRLPIPLAVPAVPTDDQAFSADSEPAPATSPAAQF